MIYLLYPHAASIEENVTLELTAEPSSVLVRWVDADLPSGVNIMHYKVEYEEKKETAQVGVVHTSPPEEVSLTVQGLRGHQHYIFRVSVVVEETDGGVYEFGGSEDGLEIFVPGIYARLAFCLSSRSLSHHSLLSLLSISLILFS